MRNTISEAELSDAAEYCRNALAERSAFLALVSCSSDIRVASLGLSNEEALRAETYRRHQDRSAFVLGRLLIRRVVGRAGPTEQSELRLTRYGRPYFLSGPAFSLSHSADWVAVAVVDDNPVGVDLESVGRSNTELNRLLTYCCHPDEIAWILNHSAPQRYRAFLKCWTRKEAILKAVGIGLTGDLRSLDSKPVLEWPWLSGLGVRVWDIVDEASSFACCLALPNYVTHVRLWVPHSRGKVVLANGANVSSDLFVTQLHNQSDWLGDFINQSNSDMKQSTRVPANRFNGG